MIENILEYSIASLFWGILIAVLLMSLFFFLIKGWYKDATFKPVSYIIATILGLLLAYNCTIICGAIAIKSDIQSFKNLIETILPPMFPDLHEKVTSEESNEVIQQALKEHPILYYYVGSGNFEGWQVWQLPSVMADTLNEFMNKLILKRCLWSLGFVVLGAFLVIKTMEHSYNKRRYASNRTVSTTRNRRTGRESNRRMRKY